MTSWVLRVFVLLGAVLAPSAQTPGTFQPQGSLGVISTAPAALAVAAATSPIVIRFDRSVDPSSVEPSTFRVRGVNSGPAAGRFVFSDKFRRVTFLPARPFAAGEVVWVHLSNRIFGPGRRHVRPGGHAFQFRIAVAPTNGNFTPYELLANDSTAFPTRITAMNVGDLDHDGAVDLVTMNRQSDDVRSFLNLAAGSGLFSGPELTVFGGEEPRGSLLVDLNGDPFLDLVVIDPVFDKLRVLLGFGDGSFLASQVIDVAAGALAAIDIDGDADLDLAATRLGAIRLLANDGFGGFTPMGSVEGGVTSEFLLEAGDMNQDGITDLVVTGVNTNDLRTVLGDGQGSFTPAGLVPHLTGGQTRALSLGDVDGDGDLDAAVGNLSHGTVGILRNLGGGEFSSVSVLHPDGNSLAGSLGDLDGDGDLDWCLAISGSSADNYWRLYRNGGNGTFTFWVDTPAVSFPTTLGLLDSDQDGDLDLALADEIAETIQLMKND